jgi:hypothetical protein
VAAAGSKASRLGVYALLVGGVAGVAVASEMNKKAKAEGELLHSFAVCSRYDCAHSHRASCVCRLSPAAKVDYKAVREAVVKILDKDGYDDGSIGPVLVRLAWHASGTYDAKSKTGGSHGATMRFEPESKDGANAGLDKARAFLEPIKAQFPAISYADLWTFAASVAIEEMGGPKIDWVPGM